ncbi:SUN domain-containing ossification factor [Halotydeus destructor]|nr:SUN domain-containing ossification factor [Halotydeus destructor]
MKFVIVAFAALTLVIHTASANTKLNRNYASYECGAKVIASNPEAEGASRILSEAKDEYLLNPCKAKIWFVVELCEPIQPSSIELANFELFSSTPKELIISGSERFPTREWTALGTFTASDERIMQHFNTRQQSEFLKFIKIEMSSHYGSEHYCPISVLRAFGTSLVEEFDAIESGSRDNADDMDQLEIGLIEDPIDSKRPNNLLGSAREAVISMVRRAAAVLSKRTTDDAIDDSVIAKQFVIHQRALRILNKIEPVLKRSDCIRFSRNFTTSSQSEFSRPCLYVESLLGLPVYQVLCDELLREPAIRFKCEVNSTTLIEPLSTQHMLSSDKLSVSKMVEINLSDSTPSFLSSLPSSIVPTTPSSPVPLLIVTDTLSDLLRSTVIPTPVGQSTDASLPTVATENFTVGESVELYAKTVNELDNNETQQAASLGNQVPLSQPVPAAPASVAANNGAVLAASSSKESIFVKLNNRIKALEQNMSAASQKIDEIIVKHSDEIGELNRLLVSKERDLNETLIRMTVHNENERQSRLELEKKLRDVSEILDLFITEKETLHWSFLQVHVALLFVETILIIVITSICLRRLRHFYVSQALLAAKKAEVSTETTLKRSIPGGINIFDNLRETHSPAKTKRLETNGAIFVSPPATFTLENLVKKKKRKKKPKMNCPVSQPLEAVGHNSQNNSSGTNSPRPSTPVAKSGTTSETLTKCNFKPLLPVRF